MWFYPDGTTGGAPWFVDPASPTGWSLPPNPCANVAEPPDYDTWAAYVDGTNYPDLGIEVPALTTDQIRCGEGMYGWWW